MKKILKKVSAQTVFREVKGQFFKEVDSDQLEFTAVELLKPVVEVIFDRVVPLRDKIIVQGRIFKNIIYKDDDFTVRHHPETIKFGVEIDVPGFVPGSVHNGRHFKTGNDYKFFVDQLFVDQVLNNDNTVTQKIVLKFIVKILRDEQLEFFVKCPQPSFHFKGHVNC